MSKEAIDHQRKSNDYKKGFYDGYMQSQSEVGLQLSKFRETQVLPVTVKIGELFKLEKGEEENGE